MSCSQLCQVFVHLWLLLLILAPGREQSGVPPKAVLLLNPPWSPTFKGKTVTLRCMDFNPPSKGRISWLRDKKTWTTVSEDIAIEKSGRYQCKTPASSLSDPVHVEFSSDWLILQALHPIYEGDDVILRCRGKEEEDTVEKTYYKDGKQLHNNYYSDHITINSVSMDPGEYHCVAYEKFLLLKLKRTSKHLRIQVQELFPHPVLTASPSQPLEGGPVTLTCETQLPPQKRYVRLQFCFFRDVQILGSGCSSSPELQIPAMHIEDSGSYWCQAETVTPSITKRSPRSQIHVQRVPVSTVNLEVQPPEGQLVEGHNLVLICSVAKGTGIITFSWHRDGVGILGRKTQHSLLARLQVSAVKERDAGRYYCTADNSNGPILSQKIRVTVKIPASGPVLSIRVPRVPTAVGDVVELHCEALRGSPPILYLFYHEDVILGNSSALSGGGASFNLSLTVERSGNYTCEADNGLGAQRSRRVSLRATVPVSRPVLTLRPPGTQAVVGDVVELHCEALRGSPPVLYRFYHENVTLGSSSAPSGAGAAFSLLVNTEHAGNYSCEADNGLGAQLSEVMTLQVTGISRNRTGPVAAGVTGGLLGLAVAAALLYHFRTQRKSGGLSATGTPSYGPNEHQEPSLSRPSIHSEPLALKDLQPVYSNVNLGNTDSIYSQIQNTQHTNGNLANSPRTPREDKGPVVIYSELKKVHSDDFAEPASRRQSAHEDAAGNYENVSCATAASDH